MRYLIIYLMMYLFTFVTINKPAFNNLMVNTNDRKTGLMTVIEFKGIWGLLNSVLPLPVQRLTEGINAAAET